MEKTLWETTGRGFPSQRIFNRDENEIRIIWVYNPDKTHSHAGTEGHRGQENYDKSFL